MFRSCKINRRIPRESVVYCRKRGGDVITGPSSPFWSGLAQGAQPSVCCGAKDLYGMVWGKRS